MLLTKEECIGVPDRWQANEERLKKAKTKQTFKPAKLCPKMPTCESLCKMASVETHVLGSIRIFLCTADNAARHKCNEKCLTS